MKAITSIFCFVFTAILVLSPVAPAQFVCQPTNSQTVTGAITAGDTVQSGRITRDARPGKCGIPGAANLENNDVLRGDAHNFANPFNETVCVKVEMDFTGCGGIQVQSVAYSSYNAAQPAQNVIGDSGYSTLNKGSYLFSVSPNANFAVVVHNLNTNDACPLYKLKITYLRGCRQPGFDKTNDGKADIAVYRTGATAQWWTLDSQTQQGAFTTFGTVGDVITGANDYTGDGVSDVSVYRPSTSTWYYGLDQVSPGTNFSATPWGASGDRVVPGDYDGDGKTDIAVWRPADGNFYVLRSSDGTAQIMHWGSTNDRAVSGDFDGDTVSDFAVARATSGGLVWYILKSNYNYGFNQVLQWGLSAGDKIVPADYDGDSITDIAVWRESEGMFYVRRSSDLSFQAFNWGTSGDKPQPADYDGDKKADFAIYRPVTGMWYIHNSSTQTYNAVNFGLLNDQATTAPYRVQ